MKTIFISNQIPDSLRSIFTDMGLKLVLLPAEPSLPEPVSAHADMLMYGNIVQKDYYGHNKELFDGFDMILADESFGDKYPDDVLLNAFAVADALFGRLESLSVKIKQLYPKAVNLRQGYAKCSTLLFQGNAVTADRGIADALTKHGLKVLLITPGHIALHGYDYGFIGGASGKITEDTVIFFGDVENHRDFEKIRAFLSSHGCFYECTDKEALRDIGGMIPLCEEM